MLSVLRLGLKTYCKSELPPFIGYAPYVSTLNVVSHRVYSALSPSSLLCSNVMTAHIGYPTFFSIFHKASYVLLVA